jgi:hypothetical protein
MDQTSIRDILAKRHVKILKRQLLEMGQTSIRDILTIRQL